MYWTVCHSYPINLSNISVLFFSPLFTVTKHTLTVFIGSNSHCTISITGSPAPAIEHCVHYKTKVRQTRAALSLPFPSSAYSKGVIYISPENLGIIFLYVHLVLASTNPTPWHLIAAKVFRQSLSIIVAAIAAQCLLRCNNMQSK